MLDLVSVFAFAYFGAHAGLERGFTVLGILTCAFLPALGGGTIREMMLGHVPTYFHNYTYGLMVVMAVIFALITQYVTVVKRYMYILDALGMAVFAYLGTRAALRAGLGVSGSMLFAVLTACGGGILCDIVTGRRPHAFTNRWYAAPVLLLPVLLCALGGLAVSTPARLLVIGGIFTLQLTVTYQMFQNAERRNAEVASGLG